MQFVLKHSKGNLGVKIMNFTYTLITYLTSYGQKIVQK
jgi:hypothetical protein